MNPYYGPYDVGSGLAFVGGVFLALGVALLTIMPLVLYRLLSRQDRAIRSGDAFDIRNAAIDVAKGLILWVIGYGGEERERTRKQSVDEEWMSRYSWSVVWRFIPFYALYIITLVWFGRPVYFIENEFRIFGYTSHEDLYMIYITYVLSNAIFDYFSLRFTLAHMVRAQREKRYYVYFFRDAFVALCLFIFSQAVSCFLWTYKRETPGFPEFDNFAQAFVQITLWPYSFVIDGNLVGNVFPGQVLITGTVFFPTMTWAMFFVLISLLLDVSYYAKVALRKVGYTCDFVVTLLYLGGNWGKTPGKTGL